MLVVILFVVAAVIFGIDFLAGFASPNPLAGRINALAFFTLAVAFACWKAGK